MDTGGIPLGQLCNGMERDTISDLFSEFPEACGDCYCSAARDLFPGSIFIFKAAVSRQGQTVFSVSGNDDGSLAGDYDTTVYCGEKSGAL